MESIKFRIFGSLFPKIQIFLMPLLMVGHNLQAKREEIPAENNYSVNIKAEKEITLLINEIAEIKAILVEQRSK